VKLARSAIIDALGGTGVGSQLFILETAAALHAEVYHDSIYGQSGRVPDMTDEKDYLVGWLDRCLANAGLAPESSGSPAQNPGDAYAKFLGVAEKQTRVRVFGRGYTENVMPPLPLEPNLPIR
jgi:hypothetical protein